jgi:rhamnose transport system permease protein
MWRATLRALRRDRAAADEPRRPRKETLRFARQTRARVAGPRKDRMSGRLSVLLLVGLALAGCGGGRQGDSGLTVAMMPKNKGNPYFLSCRKGAEEAAKELGVRLLWDGPTETDPAKQNEVVEGWITRGVDVLAVSVENKEAISTALRRAREKGIKVVTFDADAETDARDVFVNQATPEGIAHALMDRAAKLMGEEGRFAIVTASLTAANQNEWIKHIRARLAERYPRITLVDVRPSDDDRQRAFNETQTLLKVHPDVKLVMAIASPAVPGAAEAVKQSGRTDVKVTGLGLPNACKPYIHDGVVESIVLWNTMDLGYLTIRAAHALATGALTPGQPALEAGRLGRVEVRGDNVLLGTPFTFTRENVDQFDF